MTAKEKLLTRFKAKIAFGQPNGCDEWVGAKNEYGYGRILVDGRNRHTHRVAWEVTFGPIPDGMMVCHRCDNRLCVNPSHLFLGTNSDNMRDMIAKGRSGHLKGEVHPKAKLHPADVLAIRSSSQSNTELARLYSVTRKAVAHIRERKNWRHI